MLTSAENFAARAVSIHNDLPDGYWELSVAKLFLGAIEESVEALEMAETVGPYHKAEF
ncbi:hypothetical protein PH562_02480 [Rhizobium sp. CNPSo 4062]|uniref:hypothetical protein n=1 Tax=Rhizobium sp. CNPSo 4062 TaxID=3021410 RepID=UPI00254BB8B9|nr:hypothetical protein [Rhizobium sp. CNPSo 4062]MDK4701088.1 hypothetical protein [Rhizobium sp. CNPSo 4062]